MDRCSQQAKAAAVLDAWLLCRWTLR